MSAERTRAPLRWNRLEGLRQVTIALLASFALVGAAAFEAPARAQGGAMVALDPPIGSFYCGESWTVDLLVNSVVTDLRGLSMVLEFDPTVVAPSSVAPGALVTGAGCANFTQWLNASAIGDSIAVDMGLLGCSAVGPGAVLQIELTGVAPGTSPLRVRHGILRDSLNHSIPFSALDASVAWGCPRPGEVILDPGSGQFGCHEILTVDVAIDAAIGDLRGFSFVFDFDPAVVHPVSVTAGPLETGASCPNLLQWLNASAVGDSIAVDGATLGCSVAGPGVVLHLSFAGVADGVSSLGCRRGLLRTGANEPIPFVCQDISLQYSCPVPVSARSWGSVKEQFGSKISAGTVP